MTYIEKKHLEAEENFKNGYNCAQSVFLCFIDELGLDKDLALKIAQPFGGGTCRTREICGTITGMLMALGLKEGSSNPKDKDSKDRIYATGQKLMKKFSDLNGSCICKELLGIGTEKQTVNGDAKNPVSEERTAEYYKKRPCPKLCGDSAAILAEYFSSL